jgi:hypothetical protein
LLYPGNQLSQYVLRDAIFTLERVLNLSCEHRKDICLRMDAGFGTDDRLDWVLGLGYQVCAKNNSGRRAGAWGQQIQTWQEVEAGHRWVGIPQQQLSFCAPTRTIAVRWLDHRKNTFKHALFVVTDLHSSLPDICRTYDLRGGAEIDIRDDKQGLLLTHRRKRLWHAQEMLILLNDLAHNFLSMLRYRILADTPLSELGTYRLIQDVLNVPGEIEFDGDQLVEVRLSQDHPYAEALLNALPKLWY